MKQLGVSIYPDKTDLEENKSYLKMAASYGFVKVFTCFLSPDFSDEEFVEEFKEITSYCRELGMEVYADVNPSTFEKLTIDKADLSFFKQLHLTGIRLDDGFTGMEESMMTYNEAGLAIEINMSKGTKYLDNILSHRPKREMLVGCHNFYPRRYTGISRQHFTRTSKQYKDAGLRTAAFINSSYAKIGPWDINEGLPTLEEHRTLSIETQAKDLFHTDLIDTVIIGNAFASEEELRKLSELNKDILTLRIRCHEDITDVEREIIFDIPHFRRGDVTEYVIRSTGGRSSAHRHRIPFRETQKIKRGDVLIDSKEYSHYAGELQIALKDLPISGKTNVVGRIVEEEQYLLDYIEPWHRFAMIE